LTEWPLSGVTNEHSWEWNGARLHQRNIVLIDRSAAPRPFDFFLPPIFEPELEDKKELTNSAGNSEHEGHLKQPDLTPPRVQA
jgi:hypothetical protein